MSVNIGPRIGIDGESEYRAQIRNIIQQTKTLKSEYDKVTSAMDKNNSTLKNNAEQHRILNEQIKAQGTRVKELAEMVKQSADKYGEADTKTLKWKQALNEATTELNKLKDQLNELPNKIELVGTKMESAGKKISDAGRGIENFGRALTPLSAAAAGAIAGSVKSAIDFETAMTGVKKTNDELVDSNGNVIISYDDLADAIKDMATRTASSKDQIAGVMESAGQLGVGTQYLEDFTEAMIKMGDSTNLSAEEAAAALAKFANVTGMDLKDTEKLGSVIVALGNNFATTETDIVEMATRLAGAGHQVGLTDAQIMGFATALSSVGIEAEMGGSAFSKALIKMQVATESGYSSVEELRNQLKALGHDNFANMSFRELYVALNNDSKALTNVANWTGHTKKEILNMLNARKDLESFAEVSGMTAEEFVDQYGKDAPTAIQKFISGLGDTENKGESTIQMLQDMGFTEVRLRDTLTRLASSGNLVTDAISMGSDAWEKNTALTEEAEKKYSTMEAQMSQAREKLTNVGEEIGQRLLPYLDKGLDVIDKLIKAWDGLNEEEQDQIVKAALITAAAAPVITTGGKIIEGLGSITNLSGTIIKGSGSLISAFSGASTAAGGLGTSAGAAAGGLAGIAAPAAAVVGALALVAGAFVTAYNTDEDFAKAVDKNWAQIKKDITDTIAVIKPAWEAFSKALAPVLVEAMESMSRRIQNFKNFFKGVIDVVAGLLNGDWKRAFKGAEEVATSMWNNVIEGLRTLVRKIEALFGNLKIELPHIKLPHFIVEGEDGFGLPHISIDWYAKAMSHGMRLTSPTIFGVNKNGLMGGGEVGNEWVVGESSILGMIRTAVRQATIPSGGNNISVGDTTIVINATPSQDVEELANAVDEIMAARYQQVRQAWA